MTNLAIEVHHLKKIFRTPGNRVGNTVLSDISFELPKGASVAVTGENGSGKTTLLKVLATLYLPDSGSCRILGMDLVKEAAEIRDRIAFVSPGLDFQRKLTLEENLKFFEKTKINLGKNLNNDFFFFSNKIPKTQKKGFYLFIFKTTKQKT